MHAQVNYPIHPTRRQFGLGAAAVALLGLTGCTSAVSQAAKSAEDVPSSVELRWRPGEHQAALTS